MEGVDAGYLYMETPSMHMHTLKIAVVEPAESFDPSYFTEVVLERLQDLPAFGRRALKVPFGLNHPLWIADRPIDPARHVFVHRVPEPGGMAGLETLIGEIGSRPLDQSLPLWEVHVTEPTASLGGGTRVAVVAKMHHALADGGAANALLGAVTDAVRDELGVPARQVLEPTPSRSAQVRMALLDALAQVLSIPALLLTTVRGVAAVLTVRRRSEVRVPRPVLDAPRTPFNAALTARRTFATASLPLAEVRAVGKAHGVTVNDVVLALVSGALRAWLDEHGLRPGRSLLAGVPVGTDTAGAATGPRLGGNRVSNLFTTLATDVDDPAERLRLISVTTRESKLVQQTLGNDLLREWVQFTPPGPMSLFMKGYSRGHLASRHNPPFNVVVSNVRGPGQEVTVAGARLVDLFSVGPILEGIGLNVTAWSYDGRLNFSLLGCPDLVADLRPIAAGLGPALAELQVSARAPDEGTVRPG
jgi:diacylglycerol O-acyltransferase